MTKKPKQKQKLEVFALAVTNWVGSLQSILVHSLLFIASFTAVWLGVLPFDRMLLVLTTVVSLEAIYLSIFIQMTINFQAATIEVVEKNLDEIQEDIDEIQEDVGEIQEDVDEIQEDMGELQEDVEEMTEDEKIEEAQQLGEKKVLEDIYGSLQKLMKDVEQLQKKV